MKSLKILPTWQDCDRCEIASCHKAFYRGSSSPLILFIAQSLGHADTVTHEPLSSRAGKLLDKLAKDCSLSRESYGVTALVGCLTVKANDMSKDRDPTKEEIKNCQERLDDLIELALPRYYVALGPLVKKHPPEGIKFSLQMDNPVKWDFSGGEMSLSWKRDRHKLKKFLREIEYDA